MSVTIKLSKMLNGFLIIALLICIISVAGCQQKSLSNSANITNTSFNQNNVTPADSQLKTSPPTAIHTVTNPLIGIKFSYPDSWQIHKNNATIIELWGNDNPSGEGGQYFVQLIKSTIPSSSLESAALSLQESLKSIDLYRDSEIISINSQIGNQPAKKFIITRPDGRIFTIYITIYHDTTYLINPLVESDNVKMIIDSIEFI